MKVLNWKQRQALQVPKPRVLKSMRAKPLPLGCKVQRNATSCRTKQEFLSEKISLSMLEGRKKIMAFIDRGIRTCTHQKPS